MKEKIALYLKRLRAFALGEGKNIFFTCLFYALWLAAFLFTSTDFSLERFPKRMIGMGSFYNYDVGTRLSLFYKCGALIVLVIIVLYSLALLIRKFKPGIFTSSEIKIVNYTSLSGIFFFLVLLMGFENYYCLELLYFIHKLMLAALLIQLFKGGRNVSVSLYAIILSLAFSLYFFIADISVVCGTPDLPDFLITTFIISLILIGIKIFAKPFNGYYNAASERWSFVLLPLTLAPLIAVLKDEIFLVLKGKGNDPDLALIFLLLWIIPVLMIFFRYKKSKKDPGTISMFRLVSHSYFPLLILSLLTYNLYNYRIVNSPEAFEAANKYLPLMEFNRWGVVPILEKFNSHVLSDFFFSSIYVFFNGMQGMEMELYDFLVNVINGILYYYLFLFITRNAYIALFTVLFFPFYIALSPNQHAFMIIGIFAIWRLSAQKTSLKNYLLFFWTFIFLLIWKIDVGFACVFLLPISWIFYSLFVAKQKPDLKLLLKAAVVTAAICGVFVAIIALSRHIDVIRRARYVLGYLDSAQTYGYTFLGDANAVSYKMLYYVFPALIIITLLALMLRYREMNISRKQKLAYLSMFMIIVYYIINFQRGLVRHCLYENNDGYLVSFGYIILSFSPFIFFHRAKIYARFAGFCAISFFALTNYKHPQIHASESMYENLGNKLKRSELTHVAEVKDRVILVGDGKPWPDLVKFLSKNLGDKETFIDFTDHPMLHFYTQKITPSFFFQNPICSHTDYLQEAYVDDLKHYDIPYVVYSMYDSKNPPEIGPNSFMHYKITEYLNQHYHPYLTINNFNVWKRNGLERKDTEGEDLQADLSMAVIPEQVIVSLPHTWGTYDKVVDQEKVLFEAEKSITLHPRTEDTISLPDAIDKSSGNTVLFEAISPTEKVEWMGIKLISNGKTEAGISFEITASAASKKYAVRISSTYKWYQSPIKKLVISTTSPKPVIINNFRITKAL
jgi:hypothetical protein